MLDIKRVEKIEKVLESDFIFRQDGDKYTHFEHEVYWLVDQVKLLNDLVNLYQKVVQHEEEQK